MTKILNIAMGAAAAAALLAPVASAEKSGDVSAYIDQVQLGDVWSGLNVEVRETTKGDLSGTTTSVGNATAATTRHGNVAFTSSQATYGASDAETIIDAGRVHGNVYSTTTAYANTSTANTWTGSTQFTAEQSNAGDVEAFSKATATKFKRGAGTITGIANVATSSAEFGNVDSYTNQTNTGSSSAKNVVIVDRNTKSIDYSVIAGGNAVTTEGASSDVWGAAVQVQGEHTDVVASSRIKSWESRSDVAATVTAAANSYTLTNYDGNATLGASGSELYQENGANVEANNRLVLESWNGQAFGTSYGVGNSALIHNQGGDTGLFSIQNNFGDVSSDTFLRGNSSHGDTAIIDATAIGNAATASHCTHCGDGALTGSAHQTNYGSSYAQSTFIGGSTGTVYGSATAVGNTATFTASGH